MAAPPSHERRQAPRTPLQGQVAGRLLSLNLPMVVLDISLTGTLVRTLGEVPVGAVQDFSLTLDEVTVYLRGLVVRSRPAKGWGHTQWYETAFMFIDESVAHDAGVAGLLAGLKLLPTEKT